MTKAERNGERREEGMERRGQEEIGRRVGNNGKRRVGRKGGQRVELRKKGRDKKEKLEMNCRERGMKYNADKSRAGSNGDIRIERMEREVRKEWREENMMEWKERLGRNGRR
jgi:hypothetical protein